MNLMKMQGGPNLDLLGLPKKEFLASLSDDSLVRSIQRFKANPDKPGVSEILEFAQSLAQKRGLNQGAR